jgi:predicted dehydrogenase
MAEAVKVSGGTDLHWVIDTNLDRARFVAEKYQAFHVGTDYEKALKDPDVDIVTVFASPDKSPDLCIAAVEAGKHIINVKPMAVNLHEADRIVAAIRRYGVKYFSGAGSHLFSDTNQYFKNLIDEGKIGTLLGALAIFHGFLPRDWPDSTKPGWFVDTKCVPGGAWIDHAIFYLPVFTKLINSDISQVEGIVQNLKYPDLAVEDYGQAILTFSNGVVITITSSWIAAPNARRQNIEFIGSEGMLVWDTLLNKIAITGKFGDELKGWIQVDEPSGPHSRAKLMIDHLIACIHENREPMCTVEDDRSYLALSLDFYKSAHSHRAVSLLPY